MSDMDREIARLRNEKPDRTSSDDPRAIWLREFLTASWLRCSDIANFHERELTFALGPAAAYHATEHDRMKAMAHGFAASSSAIADLFSIPEYGHVWDVYHSDAAERDE